MNERVVLNWSDGRYEMWNHQGLCRRNILGQLTIIEIQYAVSEQTRDEGYSVEHRVAEFRVERPKVPGDNWQAYEKVGR